MRASDETTYRNLRDVLLLSDVHANQMEHTLFRCSYVDNSGQCHFQIMLTRHSTLFARSLPVSALTSGFHSFASTHIIIRGIKRKGKNRTSVGNNCCKNIYINVYMKRRTILCNAKRQCNDWRIEMQLKLLSWMKAARQKVIECGRRSAFAYAETPSKCISK